MQVFASLLLIAPRGKIIVYLHNTAVKRLFWPYKFSESQLSNKSGKESRRPWHRARCVWAWVGQYWHNKDNGTNPGPTITVAFKAMVLTNRNVFFYQTRSTLSRSENSSCPPSPSHPPNCLSSLSLRLWAGFRRRVHLAHSYTQLHT